MSNGGPKRAFARRSLDVDVDALIVAGAVREFSDSLLIHPDPAGDAELPSDEPVQRGQTEQFSGHTSIPSPCNACAPRGKAGECGNRLFHLLKRSTFRNRIDGTSHQAFALTYSPGAGASGA